MKRPRRPPSRWPAAGSNRAAILEALPATNRQLCAVIGQADNYIARTMARLREDGLARSTSLGWPLIYDLTDHARKVRP